MNELIPDSYDIFDGARARKVHVVSLGCPKNRVDSEVMLGKLRGAGHELVDSPDGADVLVVNTCAFIDSAKEESIDTILEMAEVKARDKAETLVVTGCLAQRYSDELVDELPEVDYFLGTNEYKRINEAVTRQLPERAYISEGSALYTSDEARLNSIRGGSAYLKIAEGCNRTCSFCIIPKIRGKQQSREIDDLVAEARLLAASGVKEVNLIAQDLTSYGVDVGNRRALVELIDKLEAVEGLRWIRLHYAYPWNLTDELLERLAAGSKLVPYVDMPLQHISDRMLKSMRRAVRAKDQRALIRKLRDVPGMVLRTTFIAGYPGETEEEFLELKEWLEEVKFDRVGVFAYSPEKNTRAYDMDNQISHAIAEQRRDALMETQVPISRRLNESLIGEQREVIVDGVSKEHEFVLEGRHYGQALDIDGVTYLSFENGASAVTPGDMVTVEIEDASTYDLVGRVL